MRGLEGLLIALVLGLLGIAVWQSQHWVPRWSATVPSTETAPESVAKVTKATTNSKPRTGRPDRFRRKTATSTPFDALAEANTTVVVVPLPSIPESSDLRVGITRTQIRDKYGEPSLNVSARQNGRLVERYYYLNGDQTRVTVATLQDGTLVSAQTVSR
jgi:hypothetical protein